MSWHGDQQPDQCQQNRKQPQSDHLQVDGPLRGGASVGQREGLQHPAVAELVELVLDGGPVRHAMPKAHGDGLIFHE